MAPTMMCRAHGPIAGQNCEHPGCMETPQPYVAAPEPAVETCSVTGCDMPLPCPLHPAGNSNSLDAGQREVLAYQARQISTTPTSVSGAAVEFPWGSVEVPPEGLIVGRDFGLECGAQIDTFDNVSRTHASVSIAEGQLYVEDLGSTNGTTINGRPARCGTQHALADGDVLGFGNRLRATVSVKSQ